MIFKIKDGPGKMPVEKMRTHFEGIVRSTALFAATTLETVNLGGKFSHYLDADTDLLWFGFALGLRFTERAERSLPGSQHFTPCLWNQDDLAGYWQTSCEHYHDFTSGTPADNRFKFCPYCGKEIA